jgi:hypothetical protein
MGGTEEQGAPGGLRHEEPSLTYELCVGALQSFYLHMSDEMVFLDFYWLGFCCGSRSITYKNALIRNISHHGNHSRELIYGPAKPK